MNELACYHCDEPVPAGERRFIEIDGERKPLCCAGCEAVAKLILDSGLEDFYRFRSSPAAKVEAADLARWRGFDETAVLETYAPSNGDERELRIQLDNVRCAACGWLVEKSLGAETGVCDIRLNPVTGLATLRWKQNETALSSLLAALDKLGFKPHPLRPDERAARSDAERKSMLKRLAIAGLGMMQVMMYGIAMYIGAFEDMDTSVQQFLRYVSLLIATPVVFYSAAPFFRSAWRDITARMPGMDVPVSLAIAAAYSASAWHTFTGAGEVYFDSVSMFVFFLLIGRYAEASARQQVSETGAALAATLPATAECLDQDGKVSNIPLTLLKPGDRVLVTNGSVVPADGSLLSNTAELDEALLTGEAGGVRRAHGEQVPAGAINRGAPFEMNVARVGRDTFISSITRLLEQSQASRPRIAKHADRIARWFVAGVLFAASVTAFAWWQLDPARAFEITLSVLVVTCPCALALAVPVALTAATGRLARMGLLSVNSDALENLRGITDVIFDKTGTLTTGKPRIRRRVISGVLAEQECLALAAGLESKANHPLAAAFSNIEPAVFTGIEQTAGQGLSGIHNGRIYRIGTPQFALGENAPSAPPGFSVDWIVLADDDGALAWFEPGDSLRTEAFEALRNLREQGLVIHLLSGDGESAVQETATRLGISHWHARQQPQEKLGYLTSLQEQGRRVLMIGDGINDAPVLAAANVSIAVSRGAVLAQSAADLLLTGPLTALPALLGHAKRTGRVMRQNLYWALAYNTIALPAAAAGFIAPWMAAIGMSASSLAVTLNALRLGRHTETANKDELLMPLIEEKA